MVGLLACFIFQAGRTILKLACENGNIEIAELLVAAKCDINLQDNVSHLVKLVNHFLRSHRNNSIISQSRWARVLCMRRAAQIALKSFSC